jgi:cysteine rich repeat protein
MSVRLIFLAAALLILSSSAMAQSGTPEEQAACRPDVRRFCYRIKPNEGSNAYLSCLQEHRVKLSVRCRAVLERHGV